MKIPSPETLYTVWQLGWAVGGACLLWRSRAALRRESDGRAGWDGKSHAVVVYFGIYVVAYIMNIGLSAGLAHELGVLFRSDNFERALFTFFNPALMALVLLAMRRFTPEFSPQRPHRVKPAGPFGFTAAGLLRGFAGSLALLFVTGLVWGGVLWLVKLAGLGDYAHAQPALAMIAGASDWRVLAPFVLGVTVFAPIHEELFYRSGVFAVLRGRFSPLVACLLCGLIFSLMHLSVYAFLPLLVFGAWLAWLYDNTADIRVPIVIHAVFNLTNVIWAVLAPGAVA